MMVSEEAGTVQEDVTSTEASTQSENQGKVDGDETKSGRPSALGGAAALATATIDADGYCNIVCRVKDMLIRGGENVYPREIEEFLLSHPAIQDVQVFGVPDRKYGEEICAWIIPMVGNEVSLDNVRSYCDGQIAHYKIPKYVKVVSEFPMTVTGKPQKYLMRESMTEELGLEQVETA